MNQNLIQKEINKFALNALYMNKERKDKRILFDLNHPADYHFFKYLFIQLQQEEYQIYVIARDKDCLQDLLINAEIPFLNRGKGSHSRTGKYIYGLYLLLLIIFKIIITRPGITISLSSPYLALASKLSGIPCITYDDTDHNPRLRPMLKQSSYIFSPSKYPHKFHTNHFHLDAFKELAYLHPKYFQKKKTGNGLFIRLTRTDSIHHTSYSRMDPQQIIDQVNRMSNDIPTWVSSEIDLNETSLNSELQFPDTMNIHNDLQSCSVFWGNSATMAAESAVLGIPAVFVSGEKFSYIKELESYGLLFYYSPDQLEMSFNKVKELLAEKSLDQFELLRDIILKEKIDITSFLTWFIKHLPDSVGIIRSDPDYTRHFLA